jgi:transposase
MKHFTRKKNLRPLTSSTQAQQLSVVHPDAAGIDVGSEIHFVAVATERDPQPVRRFGCTTPQLLQMGQWLRSLGITSVAMESTGVYWVPVAEVLEEANIEVYLVDARLAKALPGRKTDVQDCQWLQQLHTFGLLHQAFRPSREIRPLRELWRHRRNLIQHSAQSIQHMQKALEQMNLQLHKVLSDISGLTGMRMLRAIVDGQRDPAYLVSLCHPNCKGSREQFLEALSGHYTSEQLFILRQALEDYDHYQSQIRACDEAIQQHMQSLPAKADKADLEQLPNRKRGNKSKHNQPQFDLRSHLFSLVGVDLTQIESIDAVTAFTVITEQGTDMTRFKTEKSFASHLCLCPNNIITGGRIRKKSTRKSASRAATSLRIAAQSLRRSKGPLGDCYRRLHARLGPQKAITAMAHKLAKIIYRMLKHGEQYTQQGMQEQERRNREKNFKNLARRARQIGCELIDLQTGEVLS